MRVVADSGRGARLVIPRYAGGATPRARVWLDEVKPATAEQAWPELPMPEADTMYPRQPVQPVASPSVLRPPIPRRVADLRVPPGMHRHDAVELDVRVDVKGSVGEVRWAAGSHDTAVVAAAERCARSMEFYPALLGGQPIEVWCRQRFEIAP